MDSGGTPWETLTADETFVAATLDQVRAGDPSAFVLGADMLAAALCAWAGDRPPIYRALVDAMSDALPGLVADRDPIAEECVELARAAGVLAAVRPGWKLPEECMAWWADKAQPMLWFDDERLLSYGVILNLLTAGPDAARSCADAMCRRYPGGVAEPLRIWAEDRVRGLGNDHEHARVLYTSMESGDVVADPALAVLGVLVLRHEVQAARKAG